jgi:hypothetical protein
MIGADVFYNRGICKPWISIIMKDEPFFLPERIWEKQK